jgi:hypothetical protein
MPEDKLPWTRPIVDRAELRRTLEQSGSFTDSLDGSLV